MHFPSNTISIFNYFQNLRYDDEGFHKARTQPFKQESQVKIAMEGKRYMSPEKREVYVSYPDSHARQPFTPRHTPSYAFPPPGSDIRRHGVTNFIERNIRNVGNHGMKLFFSYKFINHYIEILCCTE